MCQAVMSAKKDQVLWKPIDPKSKDMKASTPTMKNDDPKAKDDKAKTSEKDDPGRWALKTAGVGFNAFWKMQDDLDISRIYIYQQHTRCSNRVRGGSRQGNTRKGGDACFWQLWCGN